MKGTRGSQMKGTKGSQTKGTRGSRTREIRTRGIRGSTLTIHFLGPAFWRQEMWKLWNNSLPPCHFAIECHELHHIPFPCHPMPSVSRLRQQLNKVRLQVMTKHAPMCPLPSVLTIDIFRILVETHEKCQ